jgi:ribosome-binding ATPase
MKVGLIGLPNGGKTTIFAALTKTEVQVSSYSDGRAEPNLAVVEVEDPRVDVLSKMYNPKKTIYATLDLVDFAGLAPGSSKEGLFTPQAVQLLKTMDALAIVLRNFSNPEVDALQGAPDPAGDAEALQDEVLLWDLMVVEKRLETIEKDFSRGKKTPQTEREQKVLSKISEALNGGTPVRELELDQEEQKLIQGFQFLTAKPVLFIINSSEESYGKSASIEGVPEAVEFAGSFEMELSQLGDEEEAQSFMEDMGMTESARIRLTRACYSLLGYISFFTVGEDEVRAWSIREGSTAVEAAGAIHSDLARGFIRAECFTYDDLVDAGSEKKVKEAGKFRLEGKDYIVSDGDILNIRFSV